MSEKEKKIEVVTMKVGDINTNFGNPRKISNKKKEDLLDSLETFGDFGVIVIDENNNVIAGNQRVSVLKEKDENIEVTCKKLTGYTDAELKAINIKDNVHSGEWDLDMLADWTAEINLDIDLGEKKKDIDERKIPEMELIHYEKYNYVMIVCNNELDYNNLVRALGIEGAKVKISKRKIKARAVWYHKMKAKIVPYDELPDYMLDDSDIKVEDE